MRVHSSKRYLAQALASAAAADRCAPIQTMALRLPLEPDRELERGTGDVAADVESDNPTLSPSQRRANEVVGVSDEDFLRYYRAADCASTDVARPLSASAREFVAGLGVSEAELLELEALPADAGEAAIRAALERARRV